jgi:hypothetical protein
MRHFAVQLWADHKRKGRQMEVCKNKHSGKYFIYLRRGINGKALLVTPEVKIKSLNLDLFEKVHERKERDLLVNGLISNSQIQMLYKYKNIFKCAQCNANLISRITVKIDDQLFCYDCTNMMEYYQHGALQCIECNDNLIARPKIRVEDGLYCYFCAKKKVSDLEDRRRQAAQRQYELEMKTYAELKAPFDIEHSRWNVKRKIYAGHNYLMVALAVFAAIILHYIACQVFKNVPFVVGIVAFFICAQTAFEIQSRRNKEFCKMHPEPRFDKIRPQLTSVHVHHFPDGDDDGSFIMGEGGYRNEILRRDGYMCQNCAEKKESVDLEVHHVIPRADGGGQSPTNLITLCKRCHDLERWYGHVRLYPTTTYTAANPASFEKLWR